jgi:hypothetical protein
MGQLLVKKEAAWWAMGLARVLVTARVDLLEVWSCLCMNSKLALERKSEALWVY